jgi:hypothetical protein
MRQRCPVLHPPGAQKFKTQPDGLWLYVRAPDFVDAICVEVCGSIQNLNDKRSRYMPLGASILISIPKSWLVSLITVQHGAEKPIWKAMGTWGDDSPSDSISLPIRHLRVLYALKDDHYDAWVKNITPAGHEYFCLANSLASYPSPKMKAFLKQMSVSAQLLTAPYKS